MVTARRPYRSDLRARQVDATRRAVVDAAAELFVRHGYAATTLDAVAAAAGVSRRTVFNAVGGKPALLKLAFDRALVGDDEPVPMVDRPIIRRILASTDAVESIRLWTDAMLEIYARAAPISAVLAAAADVDPEAAALRAHVDAERHDGARAFAGHLLRIGGLAPGMTRDRAADVCWVHNDGALYRLLVLDRGWSPGQFRDWVVAVLTATLLPAPGAPRRTVPEPAAPPEPSGGRSTVVRGGAPRAAGAAEGPAGGS